MAADGQGLPLGNYLGSATPAKVTLIDKTIDQIAVPQKGRGRPRKNPQRIIADKGYDSDPLKDCLRRRGIELICPYRSNRDHRRYHDGRTLRR